MRVRRTGSSRLRMPVAYGRAQTRHGGGRRGDRRDLRAVLRAARLPTEAPHARRASRVLRPLRAGRRGLHPRPRFRRARRRLAHPSLRRPGRNRHRRRPRTVRARTDAATRRLPVLGLPAERARAPLLRSARRGGGRVHGRRREPGEDSRRALSMDVQQLADGLWRWTAPHPSASDWPDWGPPVPPEVGCVYYEAPDAVVLIDPLLPAAEEAQFLAHLDRDIERRGLPVSILLTAAWHRRSSAILRERYRADDRIPDSVEVFPIEGAPEEQVAYFIRPHRTLVVAEIFVGDGRGGLALVLSPALEDRAALDRSLRAIAELPVERVLVSHGQPVLADGRRAIESALSER